MEYKVIQSSEREVFEKAIAKLLSSGDGWKLAGGVSVTQAPFGLIYCQALYRE